MTILFIVESPGKIKKISEILGNNYLVKASVGHFRDLDPKKMSIDFDNHFEPLYIITKPDVVKNLRSAAKNADMIYIASDEDREGEAIADSIKSILSSKKYKRVRFNAITSVAIKKAISQSGEINQNLVDAQKARRVLDRLYGYLISPLLVQHFGQGQHLSAGRVQSVTTKIILDKEHEIDNFIKKNSESSYFLVSGNFLKNKTDDIFFKSSLQISNRKLYHQKKPLVGKIAKISLSDDDNQFMEVETFLNRCINSIFQVYCVFDETSLKDAPTPFTTSTLQQEASHKLRMPLDITMKVAQKLYEAGFITYMRTDSVEIAPEAHLEIKKTITELFGEKYYQKNVYTNKTANAQEAHEAIRPTHPDLTSIDKEIQDPAQIELYDLIWKRTIASQMKPAKIKTYYIQITISDYLVNEDDPLYYFESNIKKVIFQGYLKVYQDADENDENQNDNVTCLEHLPLENEEIYVEEINAKQNFMKPPTRYSEATLVKKLENCGIGRPSTFVNTIKTILNRKYIEIGNVKGVEKNINIITIRSNNKKILQKKLHHQSTKITIGGETRKILPTNLGIKVTDFLLTHFAEFLDIDFTAKMEQNLDEISRGGAKWYHIINHFYQKLNANIKIIPKQIADKYSKLLGKDDNDNEIYATTTKMGACVKKIIGSKTIYAEIKIPLTLESITLEDAIKLLEYPKLLGKYKSNNVMLCRGKHGFYINCEDKNYSIKDLEIETIDLSQAIEIIKEKTAQILGEHEILIGGKKTKAIIINGQYGPYIRVIKNGSASNYPIPKNIQPDNINAKIITELMKPKKKYSGSKSKKNNR